MNVGYKEVCCGNLTFHITPDKIIVCTKLQTFLLVEQQYYWKIKLNNLRVLLLADSSYIKNINDLSEWMVIKDAHGNIKGRCIDMVPYNKNWI